MQGTDGFLVERLLVGASASIGVTNLLDYLSTMRFLQVAREIQVIMTDKAARMIPPTTVEALCKSRVYTDFYEPGTGRVLHIELAQWADFFLILPASANLLAKAAHGIGDDLLSTTIIASTSPLAFVPNMNSVMMNKPAIQRNIKQLREDGYAIIDPVMQVGYQASTGKRIEAPCMPQVADLRLRMAEILEQGSA
ncbi:Mersacidin decarboxylase [Tumebacillus sp. ITR2]|uniref:Mersacidin decarboxylase n=1 Tax=Tumebacillus amylolyticus TaxID=2801339 RepID=A0ABS1J4E4_9BACL|nr:flavoprotein [Tumebacillus amylolyticus]MBL0385141.1 Mersacidin decarboxylase [Tumebacillus amylolyticus]